MFKSHQHDWAEHARTFAPPAPANAKGMQYTTHAELMRLLHGVTTFVFRCRADGCGAVKTVECLGSVVVAPAGVN